MDKHVSDLDAERLFAGASVPEPADPLTRFTADLRARYIAPAPEDARAVHLAAITQTYAELVAGADPAAPAQTTAGRRRRLAVRGSIAAVALVLVGGSAMAATGTLPDAAQNAVSRVARVFGVSIPRGHATHVPTLRTDLEHPDDVIVKSVHKDRSDDDDDHVAKADAADDDDNNAVSSTDTGRRRPRREPKQPVVDDDDSSGDSSTGSAPVVDDRGDPSDPTAGGGGGGGGGGDQAPGDGSGDGTDPGSGGSGGGGGGGRGDPKDGSPGGADAGGSGGGGGASAPSGPAGP